MMRRIVTWTLLLVLALMPLPVAAASSETAPVSGVFDSGSLLTSEELSSLERLAGSMAQVTGQSFLIMTLDTSISQDYADYSEDHFRDFVPGEYGYQNGVLLYINLADRDVYVACYDGALDVFPQSVLDSIRESITPDLTAGNYLRACRTFITSVADYIQNGKEPSNASFWTSVDVSEFLLTAAIVTLLLMGLLWFLSRRGVRTSPPAPGVYIHDGSIRTIHTQDVFIRTHTTRTEIPRNNSSGSRGGGGGGSRGGSRGSGGKF